MRIDTRLIPLILRNVKYIPVFYSNNDIYEDILELKISPTQIICLQLPSR